MSKKVSRILRQIRVSAGNYGQIHLIVGKRKRTGYLLRYANKERMSDISIISADNTNIASGDTTKK